MSRGAHTWFGRSGRRVLSGIGFSRGTPDRGAFVAGPHLPNFDLEREKMRSYYEENYSAGFDYAYTYPAMANAVQAAGRVIRSESGKGIIILMDNRCTQASYVKSMPQDWLEHSPKGLISERILADLTEFWEKGGSHLSVPRHGKD